MSPGQILVLSTSTIEIESTAQINLTPWDLELLFLEYSQKGLLFPKPTPEQQSALLAGGTNAASSIIHHLQASLRRTLHFFPPLAGRLSTSPSSDGASTSFYVDCNRGGGGALFIHAAARDPSITVADILDTSAFVPEIVRSFFPLTGVRNSDGVSQPLLAVQVTELADGLFVGCSINHLLVDGTSFWHFFNSWAEISRGEIPISKPPSFDRDQVNLDLIGCTRINISDQHLVLRNNNTVIQSQTLLRDRVFHLSKENLTKLKNRANQEMTDIGSERNISSLQAVIAHVWLSILRCRSVSSGETTFEIPMGARQRLDPPLPENYFGNAVFPGLVTLEAGEMLRNGLGWTAWQINRMVASRNGPDEVREFYENWVKNPNFLQSDGLPSNYFILINSPRFNVYGNDFGWGKPAAVRCGGASISDGRITIAEGRERGSIEIEVCLLPEVLCKLREDAEFMKFLYSND